MNQDESNFDYSETAWNYDSQVKEYDGYGSDVLFGMSYAYVKPDESL